MRFFSYLILFISIGISQAAYAEVPIYFSDVSAGVFRFQVKLADQGNPEAQYKVGEMYEMGKGVDQNLTTAIIWFEKSAAQGHKKSSYKLLFLEIDNNGLNDFTKSQLGVLRQEAAAGNSDAQYFLGKMYASGVGVPKSLNNALTWLNKATFNGVSEAEHEAIAVEEELARIREKESKKRAVALTAAKKKKVEADKLKLARQKDAEKRRKADAARNRSEKDAQARRSSEERKRLENERHKLEAERLKYEKERLAVEKARSTEQKKATQVKKDEDSSFESDPCKGKSARFLSTCR